MKREILVWVVGVIWLGSVMTAIFGWERYDSTPGRMGDSTPATIATKTGGWNLTVYIHPRCQCALATLRQLPSLVSDAPLLTVRVVFVRPPEIPAGWERGDGWDQAARITGVTVACDPDGVEAREAGAWTSGESVLTDPNGRVVFRGGLTPGRGRSGDSDGRRAVLGWVRGEPSASSADVYGCPLHTVSD